MYQRPSTGQKEDKEIPVQLIGFVEVEKEAKGEGLVNTEVKAKQRSVCAQWSSIPHLQRVLGFAW